MSQTSQRALPDFKSSNIQRCDFSGLHSGSTVLSPNHHSSLHARSQSHFPFRLVGPVFLALLPAEMLLGWAAEWHWHSHPQNIPRFHGSLLQWLSVWWSLMIWILLFIHSTKFSRNPWISNYILWSLKDEQTSYGGDQSPTIHQCPLTNQKTVSTKGPDHEQPQFPGWFPTFCKHHLVSTCPCSQIFLQKLFDDQHPGFYETSNSVFLLELWLFCSSSPNKTTGTAEAVSSATQQHIWFSLKIHCFHCWNLRIYSPVFLLCQYIRWYLHDSSIYFYFLYSTYFGIKSLSSLHHFRYSFWTYEAPNLSPDPLTKISDLNVFLPYCSFDLLLFPIRQFNPST